MHREFETGSKVLDDLLKGKMQEIVNDGESRVRLTKAEHELMCIELEKVRNHFYQPQEEPGEASDGVESENVHGLLRIKDSESLDDSKDDYIPFICSITRLDHEEVKVEEEICSFDEYRKIPSQEPVQESSSNPVPDYESIQARRSAFNFKRCHVPRADYMDGVYTIKGVHCLTFKSNCASCTKMGWNCIKAAPGEQIERSIKCSRCIRHGKSGC